MTLQSNEIVLITRDEINQLTPSPISDTTWEKMYEYITSDDNMWQVIDECIKTTVDEICGVW